MTLSIVIVNYNVKHYLRQCLFSLYAATEGIECEVFVVDNNSSDGSLEMLHDAFPQVKVIANSDNKGFAYANNQALRIATGDYILLLNRQTPQGLLLLNHKKYFPEQCYSLILKMQSLR